MKLILFLISISIFPDEFPQIIDSNTSKNVDFNFIEKEFQKVDVLVIGEEHDDKIGHKEKLKLIEFLQNKNEFIISMEMFESDQQIVLNEFLNDSIDEKIFESELKLWNNYSTDYKPIVLFAKDKKVQVIAANPPRRLVRLLSRKGFDFILNLPLESKKLLPSLFSISSFKEERYEKKILEIMQGHSMDKKNLDQMILAQHLWDASMSEKVYEARHLYKKKVIHINGRFHSDERMGVVHRLEKMGLKVLTISMFPKNDRIENKNLADIIYINPRKDKNEIQP